ncbi:MAG: tetratricopeptide repeat protein [Luteitalea sp.]|nr:tetratricopeptide repeat protein [Luteitalea sp.]
MARWWFLAAYTSSGLAGLIYEVVWTRRLTLHMGHTTAAASTVLAAFMGGLAIGSVVGGRFAARLTRRKALYLYALLEVVVAVSAIAMPLALEALKPMLRWSYQDGTGGALFPLVRLVGCLVVLLIPTTALGATFPMAVRGFVSNPDQAARVGGLLYAVNTSGAAMGALAAGFLLIPAVGLAGTTLVGVIASGLSVLIVVPFARATGDLLEAVENRRTSPAPLSDGPASPTSRRTGRRKAAPTEPDYYWVGAGVLAATGCATFTYEVVWTRVISMIVGPSTYAFAATLTAFISALAAGSFLGSRLTRTRQTMFALGVTLACTAIAATVASWLAGGALLRTILHDFADSPQISPDLLARHLTLAAGLMVPTALGLGMAFPLALKLAASGGRPVVQSFGIVYGINAIAAVTGALVTGFVAIPLVGLQQTLSFATVLLLVVVLMICVRVPSVWQRVGSVLLATTATALLIWTPRWDTELIASGGYKYARYVPGNVDLETALKAGTLRYYREGAAGTVTVKELTGGMSLAIDGKVDASTTGDMITQKTLAHLPLLLHPDPRDVCIVGLGSGVTLASALVHPVAAVDVVEISPEVVEASRLFAAGNRNPLDDPRTRLIVGDGRSHLSLSSRKYDIIISEPSNPWMAGVAALFTREFFMEVRDRLTVGGIICQWVSTYDISDADLRSVVATFASVFPHGTMWLVGGDDLLLIGAAVSVEPLLDNIERRWETPGVAADLNDVGVLEPFGLWSLFVGGPAQAGRYAGTGELQTDSRMKLEFSGPRALYGGGSGENAAALRALLDVQTAPPPIARAWASANAARWRSRGAMMWQAEAYHVAYQDYSTSMRLEPSDAGTLDGFVRAATASGREPEALDSLRSMLSVHPQTLQLWVALSKLYAASGAFDEAVQAAREAVTRHPAELAALEQLASIYSDLGDAPQLEPVVVALNNLFPNRRVSRYYSAALQFLNGRFPEALELAQQTIELDRSHAPTHNLAGAIHANLGQTGAARDAFQDALRLNPRDSATYANLGLLELSLGNWATAGELFAQALSLDPTSSSAQQGLAQARLNGFDS